MDHQADVISTILFKVVIARTYLGRLPSDDEQIFYLAYTRSPSQAFNSDSASLKAAKLGKISRKLTIHEIVMSASLDSSYSSETVLLAGLLHQGFTTQATDIAIFDPIIEALTVEGFRYKFHESNSTGLAGGPHFQPRFKDKPLELKYTPSPEQPRPQPKALKPKPTPITTTLIPSEPKGFCIATKSKVKRNYEESLGPEVGHETILRRSKRLRKVVEPVEGSVGSVK